MGVGCVRRWLWRWRRNPLRRHDDVVEAWAVLAVWVFALLGGALAGLVTAQAADAAFRQERTERYPVSGVLLTDAPDLADRSVGADRHVSAPVRWTAGDGTGHAGRAMVEPRRKAGARVTVWVDRQGALTAEPPSPASAAVESALFGFGAAAGVGGLAMGAGALIHRRLDRRRIDAWDEEWTLVGPQWGHRTG